MGLNSRERACHGRRKESEAGISLKGPEEDRQSAYVRLQGYSGFREGARMSIAKSP